MNNRLRAVLRLDSTPYYRLEQLKRRGLRHVWELRGHAMTYEEAKEKLLEWAKLPEVINQPAVHPLDTIPPGSDSYIHVYSDIRRVRFMPEKDFEIVHIFTNDEGTQLTIMARKKQP